MQISSSSLTGSGGAGKTPAAHRSQLERQIECLQAQRSSLQEKLSGKRSSSAEQSSGLGREKTKVIMGSGGDHAIISLGKTPAAATPELSAPADSSANTATNIETPEMGDVAIPEAGDGAAATAQADMGQKALIKSINLPQISEEAKAVVADLEASAESLQQWDAALDAELVLHVQELAQSVQSPNSSGAGGGEEKSVEDSDTIMEQIASIDQKITMLEQQLRQQEMEPAGGSATQAVASGEQAKSVTQEKEPEYPAPTTDSDGHVEGYL